MKRQYKQALEQLEELVKTDWQLTVYLEYDRDTMQADIYAHAGDLNCPYAKQYDPEDGHGYSEVELKEELPFAQAVNTIYNLCMDRQKEFGEPLEPQQKPGFFTRVLK